jgi:hypothetical protein
MRFIALLMGQGGYGFFFGTAIILDATVSRLLPGGLTPLIRNIESRKIAFCRTGRYGDADNGRSSGRRGGDEVTKARTTSHARLDIGGGRSSPRRLRMRPLTN